MSSMEEDPETRAHASGNDITPDKPDGKTGRREFIDKTLKVAGAAGIAHFLLLGARNRAVRAADDPCSTGGPDICTNAYQPPDPDYCNLGGSSDTCPDPEGAGGDGDQCANYASDDVCEDFVDGDVCSPATASHAEVGDVCGGLQLDACNTSLPPEKSGDVVGV